MTAPRKIVIFNEIRDVLLLILVGFGMAYIFGFKSTKQYLILSCFTASMWVLLWRGNSLISGLISKYVNWLESPIRSFVIGFIGSVTYTVTTVYLLMQVFKASFNVSFGDVGAMLYGSVIVTLLVSLFMHSRAFLQSWKQTVVDSERLKRESVTARYETLKSQVNPHFLFNSLNALTNLVYENQDMAAKFIKQLSEVYRYVLDTRNRELVTKDEEVKFLESYLFLQKIRFGNSLTVDINLGNTQTMFPPLVLQMLIENAIKHNIITSDQPLHVSITATPEYTEIENTLQIKNVLKEDSVGIGLANIRQRYEFLSSGKVEIKQSSDSFVVRLPTINLKDE